MLVAVLPLSSSTAGPAVGRTAIAGTARTTSDLAIVDQGAAVSRTEDANRTERRHRDVAAAGDGERTWVESTAQCDRAGDGVADGAARHRSPPTVRPGGFAGMDKCRSPQLCHSAAR